MDCVSLAPAWRKVYTIFLVSSQSHKIAVMNEANTSYSKFLRFFYSRPPIRWCLSQSVPVLWKGNSIVKKQYQVFKKILPSYCISLHSPFLSSCKLWDSREQTYFYQIYDYPKKCNSIYDKICMEYHCGWKHRVWSRATWVWILLQPPRDCVTHKRQLISSLWKFSFTSENGVNTVLTGLLSGLN